MNRLFGTKKEVPVPVPVVAKEEPKIDLMEQSQKVDNRINDLDNKTAKLDQEIADMYLKLRNARGPQRNNLKQALVQKLKRRKMLNQQTGQYMKHQMTLDQIAYTQENIQNTVEMCTAIKQSNEAQKAMMKEIDLDKLEDMRDDMQDLMWEADEMNEAMDRVYDMDDIDEDDIDEELADMENDLQIQGLMGNQQRNQGMQMQQGMMH